MPIFYSMRTTTISPRISRARSWPMNKLRAYAVAAARDEHRKSVGALRFGEAVDIRP
jgi:hypothetical protein